MVSASHFPPVFQQTLLCETEADQVAAAVSLINHVRNTHHLPEISERHPAINWIAPEGASIKIEQVRELCTALAYAHSAPHYFCLLSSDTLTVPAQHALLKSLEEPPENAYLILICHSSESLLDTIRSRAQHIVIPNSGVASEPDDSFVAQVLSDLPKLSFGEIITTLEKLKDAGAISSFLSDLLQLLDAQRTRQPATLSKIVTAEKIVLDHLSLLSQNASAKLTVEHCLFEIKKGMNTQ